MKIFKRLFFTLCLVFSLCFSSFSQISLSDQHGGSDGFFNSPGCESFGEDRTSGLDGTTTWIVTQNFGDEYVPVGNGLVVLGLSALGYLAYKNKKRAKNTLMTLFVCLSLFGMTSCHKEVVNPYINGDINGDGTVYVTFNSGQQSKTDITPLGIVTFSENDVLHVFASGNGSTQPRYLGSLTNGMESGPAASFTGNIYAWETGETLSFFYLGENTVNTTGTTVIDFSDQRYDGSVTPENDLSNITKHYHIGRFQVVSQDDALTRNFTGQLKNMMALAVFDVSAFNDGTNIKLLSENNLNNVMKINLDGSVEYCVAGINTTTDNQSGHIIVSPSSSSKYVVLLPKSETKLAEVSAIFTSNTKVSSSNVSLQIKQNGFIGYLQGVVTPINVSAVDCSNDLYIDYPSPAECMSNPYVFTVMDGETPSHQVTVKKVVFSSGNLVYDQGRFKQHKNAWDVCQISSNSDIKVNTTFDRFGWGASGYTFGQPIYQPYSNSTTQYDASIGFGYGPLGKGSSTYKQSFFPDPTYRKQDWGWYQFGMNCFEEYQISSGNNSYWRTMGQNEWKWLFNSRSTSSSGLIDYATNNEVTNARFVKATLEGIRGIMIFPDTYVHPASVHLKYINDNNENGFNENLLIAEQFSLLHEAGAEFLPFDSYYNKNTQHISGTSTAGHYWSCKTQTADKAIYCKMNVTEGINVDGYMQRYQGLFVRLVFQVEGVIE